jgi:hypothetical protein
MNLRYLGDALDHWKGSLFEQLHNARLLRELAVDAMASDAEDWQAADWKLFAKLLRVKDSQIVQHAQPLAADRLCYFREVTHRGDLFLDPDTGIATGRVSNTSQYLFASELHGLLASESHRVVAVYQHIRAQRTRDRLQKVVSALKFPDRPFSCCSYESGTVAMLFLSKSDGRVDGIYQEFKSLMGSHAARRVHRWRHLQGAETDAAEDAGGL